MPIGSIISGIGGIIGAGETASATRDAANATAAATRYAADLQHQQFEQIQNNMQPFLNLGTTAENVLGTYYGIGADGSFTSTPFNSPISAQIGGPPSPTDPALTSLGGSALGSAPVAGPAPSPTDPGLRDAFRASPGYDYLIRQMTDATQNSAAGRTGAISGNMLQALQRNAGGIADQDWWNFYNQDVGTWRNNFDAANTNWSNNNQNWWNVYNAIGQNYGLRYQDIANQRNTLTSVLGGIGASGQNAAANLGGFGQAAATSIGNAAIQGANAQGAARIAGANAFTGAIPQIGNAINSLFNGGSNTGSNNGGYNYLVGSSDYSASPTDYAAYAASGLPSGANYAYPYDPGANAAGFGY